MISGKRLAAAAAVTALLRMIKYPALISAVLMLAVPLARGLTGRRRTRKKRRPLSPSSPSTALSWKSRREKSSRCSLRSAAVR